MYIYLIILVNFNFQTEEKLLILSNETYAALKQHRLI